MKRSDSEEALSSAKPEQEWRRGAVLGKGTFGLVHMAEPTEPRAPRFRDFPSVMAVKSSHCPSSKTDLENERLLLKSLSDCPHIIRYLGHEETAADDDHRHQTLHVFLEFAAGGNLAAAELPLDEPTVRRYTRSILLGVKRIHDEGFVHCDLKPENILLVGDGGAGDRFTAKVADLGMAKEEENSDDDEGFYDHERRSRGVKGTMIYLSPESAMYGVQGQPSDLWALGCVVLRMFGGDLPWDRCEKAEIRRMIASEAPVLPPGLSGDAADFLGKCFRRYPWERGTAESLLRHPFLAGQEKENNNSDNNINNKKKASSFKVVTSDFWRTSSGSMEAVNVRRSSEEKKESQENGDSSSKESQWVVSMGLRNVMLRCAGFCDDLIKTFT